jgi:hypothetical protein
MSQEIDNPYLEKIGATLPRILSGINLDPLSATFGIADREYWAWKTADFPNASLQGVIAGILLLNRDNLWPYTASGKRINDLVEALISGLKDMTRRDGSLDEAAPLERSWCTTALVGFDLLSAYEYSSNVIEDALRNSILEAVEPLAHFVIRNRESHGFISNHLSAAAAFLNRWHEHGNSNKVKAASDDLISEVLRAQSSEGWFPEYGGADPGYQSLTMSFLSDIYCRKPTLQLQRALSSSLEFLSFCVHPDGSFGGLYGSRNTRFYFPDGIYQLAEFFPRALQMATLMDKSIRDEKVVSLLSIDKGNLSPMFNSYCRAASSKSKTMNLQEDEGAEDWRVEPKRTILPEAGLIFDQGKKHLTVLSTKKGGVVYHFTRSGPVTINAGLALKKDGKWSSTQDPLSPPLVKWLSNNEISITTELTQIPRLYPTPLRFVLIRLLSITLFTFRPLRELIKNFIVGKLVRSSKSIDVLNTRKITLGENLQIIDSLVGQSDFEVTSLSGNIGVIHMASQGYWQVQDEAVSVAGNAFSN